MSEVRAALELVDEFMDALACDGWPQGLPPGLHSLWASTHMRVQTALRGRPDCEAGAVGDGGMSDELSGAQSAAYPDWHREVVLEALEVCANRPRPAAGLLVGRLVQLYGPGPAGTPYPGLVIGADATHLVLELRGGDLVALPWAVGQRITARVRACRVCGCTDERACSDGCEWVEIDLCSACEEQAEFEAREAAALDAERATG